jgi:hypothetical protein
MSVDGERERQWVEAVDWILLLIAKAWAWDGRGEVDDSN